MNVLDMFEILDDEAISKALGVPIDKVSTLRLENRWQKTMDAVGSMTKLKKWTHVAELLREAAGLADGLAAAKAAGLGGT